MFMEYIFKENQDVSCIKQMQMMSQPYNYINIVFSVLIEFLWDFTFYSENWMTFYYWIEFDKFKIINWI